MPPEYDEIIKPKKTIERRLAEAEGDGDGGAVAPGKRPPPKPPTKPGAKPAPEATAEPAVRFTTGPQKLTPEEQAKRIKQFRDLQSRQRRPAEII